MIAKIKKISLKGPKDDLKKIVDALKSTGAFELTSMRRAKNNSIEETDGERREQLSTQLASVKETIELVSGASRDYLTLLKRYKKEYPGQIEVVANTFEEDILIGQAIKPIEYKELTDIAAQEDAIRNVIDTIEGIRTKLSDIKNGIAANKTAIGELKAYRGLDINFNILRNTKETFVLAGIISSEQFSRFQNDFDLSSIIVQQYVSGVIGNTCVVLIGHKSDYALANLIFEYGFERCKFNYNATAAQKIKTLEEENLALANEHLATLLRLQLGSDEIHQLKLYHDYIFNELDTENIIESTLKTEAFFVLNGWVVEDSEQQVLAVIKEISKKTQAKLSEPSEKDIPPVVYKNNKLVAPYQSITDMYGSPSPRDIDPNLFVAFFYFLFFGVMIGDIGYGIVMFTVALAILLWFKPAGKGTRDLVAIICMGGISAVLWGLLFGSFFGASTTDTNPLSSIFPAGLIDPVNDSLIFIGLTLALGVLHLMAGLTLKFFNLFMQGRFIDAICDAFSRLVLFCGIILAVCGILFEGLSNLLGVGIWIAVITLIFIFLTAGRKNKGILGKLTGGFGGVYNLVNYFSDVLSYVRLFALGLVGAVIAIVANQMGSILMGIPVVGLPLGVLVAVVFHVFNLALGLLSAYVHNARLQFIEFFSKFYEGGGKTFVPLCSNLKYVTLKAPNKPTERGGNK